jgi:dTDP-4-amino-4,6-dideoxygalactose transaminase
MAGPGAELVGEEEIAEVLEVLRSGYLSRYGPHDSGFPAKVRRVEEAIADYVGVGYALAVNSGTSAIWLGLCGLGIGPGDEVIVPGFTYVATISAVVFARAVPVLAEIDTSLTLDPADVEARITPRTKAIVAVHMLGTPGRLDELKAIADRHGIALVEDAAQAFGASYRGGPVGGHGTLGTYSFNIFKMITCGDGGMIVTDHEDLYRRCFALHDQGHLPLRTGIEVGKRPVLGVTLRMTELCGAVLLAQFRKLDRIILHLRTNRDVFLSVIRDVEGLSFRDLPDPDGDLATHLAVIFPTERIAHDVADELGARVLAESGWHVYSNMEHLLKQETAAPRGCPFACSAFPTDASYYPGMLPATDDLLSRTIDVGIGVVDPNLSPFGLGIQAGPSEAREQAERFRRAAELYLASP